MTHPTLLLLTKDPSHPMAMLALRYAEAFLQAHDAKLLSVFFYADAASIANRLRWQSAEQFNITEAWQSLASAHGLDLPVCVSTALSRGITDTDNGTRHQLTGDNLAAGFDLVGLGELASLMQAEARMLSF
ncbi:sulfurtransferase complex subunit TusD [Psychrobacter aestuarii]|uniref:Sulfurtransferase complex subunit TusD n=1 Tax=Psychrobacter aestuarii TaxID=556327 RepID=A0ABN0VPI0_9GAMM|nr:sulfurtransferase complex subunit TusD [Psychrobacter aestuarii]